MPEMINVEEARAYARKRWPSPVVRRAIEALLDDCPRAEVESVRHGKWIRMDNTYTKWQCSSCGSKNHITHWDFCSHCGAMMELK